MVDGFQQVRRKISLGREVGRLFARQQQKVVTYTIDRAEKGMFRGAARNVLKALPDQRLELAARPGCTPT